MKTSLRKLAGIMQPAFLILPIATLVGYLLTRSFVLRSSTTLLCLAIVLMMWWRNRYSKLYTLNSKLLFIVAAFAFSFAGDYVLGHWGGSFGGFVIGVGLFLLAHFGYIGYCLSRGRLVWWLLILLLLGFGTYYFLLLRPAIGDAVTSVAVLAYILVSCLSMAAAAGLRTDSSPSTSHFSFFTFHFSFFTLGIASLLFSDFLIAQKRFLGEDSLYFLMMPTYFASQILVTASFICRSQSELKTRSE